MEARDAAKTAVLEKLNDIKTKATADKTTDLLQDNIALEEAIELFKQSYLSYHAMLTKEVNKRSHTNTTRKLKCS